MVSRRSQRTCRGPAVSGAPSKALTPCEVLKRADDVSLMVAVECAAVARVSGRNSKSPNVSTPELTMKFARPDDISNDRQPACARLETSEGGGAPASAITVVP